MFLPLLFSLIVIIWATMKWPKAIATHSKNILTNWKTNLKTLTHEILQHIGQV